MKKYLLPTLILLIAGVIYAFNNFSPQNSNEPWTEKQLMSPAELVKIVSDSSAKKPYLYSIGPGGGIPFSIEIGDTKENENLEKLKMRVNKLPKDVNIVIYCGCCPFDKCPNIRPAFKLLNEMKFTNHKLLNLSQNLKVNWIDKGYPISK